MGLTPASDSLRADHRQIEGYLDRWLAGLHHLSDARVVELRQTFEAIRRLVTLHFRKEEDIYYPRLRQIVPEVLARMDEQHEYTRELERQLNELLSGDLGLDHPRMAELRRFGIEYHDSIQHHIVEEEDYLLRLADAELTPEEQQALHREMQNAG